MALEKPVDWVERALQVMRSKNIERSVLVERLGVSHSTVSLWFSRLRQPHNIELFERIAAILGVESSYLLFGVHSVLDDIENRIVREMRRNPVVRQKIMDAVGPYINRKDSF
jgi:transcriptional regulator with XRE-family HTH domain